MISALPMRSMQERKRYLGEKISCVYLGRLKDLELFSKCYIFLC